MILKTILPLLVLLLTSCQSQSPTEGADSSTNPKENFHLYLLMGQSNMAGRGEVEAVDTLVHPRVFMLDKSLNWVAAKDPVHFDKPQVGVGLGLTFGKIMADKHPDAKIGLIPCAKGGSSITRWFPDSLHKQTNSYPYNEMLERAKKAMTEGTLKGILWHQGESDTKQAADVEVYDRKFREMIAQLKGDLEIGDMPIVVGEIGHFLYENNPLAEGLNMKFKQMVAANECMDLVTAEGLAHKGDEVHFNSEAYRELGRRYAAKMIELQSACGN